MLHFSPHGGSKNFFGNSAVMVRFAMDLLRRPQNLIGIGQQVVAVRSNKVVTHCDTFKQVFCCKTVYRTIRVSALANKIIVINSGTERHEKAGSKQFVSPLFQKNNRKEMNNNPE